MAHTNDANTSVLKGPHKFSTVTGYVEDREFKPTQYPKWKYDTTGRSKLVASPMDEQKLGKGWGDTPLDPDAEPVAVDEAPVQQQDPNVRSTQQYPKK